MDAQVDTITEAKKAHIEIHPVAVRSIVVRGRIPAKAKPLVRIHAIEEPAAYARALFIEALRREGVSVSASPFQAPTAELPERNSYGKLERVATFQSPPFSEVVKVTLKVSHNLYASTLPLLVAARNGKRTLADGLHLQRKTLTDFGVDVSTISFGGGAGGANADAVTPRASVQLLRALAKRHDYQRLEAGLPILGVDGTLVDAVPADSPAKGKVKAKTGTLWWHDIMNERPLLTSKALAGTMTTAKSRALTLAIYVNGVPLKKGVKPSEVGKTIGKLCEILYLNVP
jgi:D-alanyl-D-alanine carboxypeptidase/D-alanyl-D-alanine-endopeptidase (penicillin-binding protein 4)